MTSEVPIQDRWPEAPPGWTLLLPGGEILPGDVFLTHEGTWLPVGRSLVGTVHSQSILTARIIPPEGYARVDASQTPIQSEFIVFPLKDPRGSWQPVPSSWVGQKTDPEVDRDPDRVQYVFAQPAETYQPKIWTAADLVAESRPLLPGEPLRHNDIVCLGTGEWAFVSETPIKPGVRWKPDQAEDWQAARARRPLPVSAGRWVVAEGVGDDKKGVGTQEAPFKTLAGARKKIEREFTAKKRSLAGVIVNEAGQLLFAYDPPETPQPIEKEEIPQETEVRIEQNGTKVPSVISQIKEKLNQITELLKILETQQRG